MGLNSVNCEFKYYGLLIITFLIIWIARIPIYGTNDDPILIYMLTEFYGESTEKIVVSHYIVGYLFKWLYNHFQQVHWYPLTYYWLQCAAVLFLLRK